MKVWDQGDSFCPGWKQVMYLDQWFSTRESFAPLGDIWQYLETIFIVTTGMGEERLLASVGRGQGCC